MSKSYKRTGRLTKRQKQVLDYIKSYTAEKGFSPSIREIGEAVGLSSSSTVHAHLFTLEREKRIRRNPSKPRSIQVIDWVAPMGVDISRALELPCVWDPSQGGLTIEDGITPRTATLSVSCDEKTAGTILGVAGAVELAHWLLTWAESQRELPEAPAA